MSGFRKSFLFPGLCCVLMAGAPFAGAYQFTDTEGRTLEAQIKSADETSVQVTMKNGRSATIELTKLCEKDRYYVSNWLDGYKSEQKMRAEAGAAVRRAAEIPVKITEFCKLNLGKQVGNGECWTLADEAFKACGLRRPGNDLRVWGRLVDPAKEELRAGDIVEYRSAKFSDGSWTGPEHTSVVVKADKEGIVIAQQNWAGKKTVMEMGFDPAKLTSGTLMIYRPE